MIERIRRLRDAYRDAAAILRRAPAGAAYALLGGVAAGATVGLSIGLVPFGVVLLGFDPSVIATRVGFGYLLTTALAVVVFTLAVCVWLLFKAAAVGAIGTRLRSEANQTGTAAVVGARPSFRDIWRPLLEWAIVKALSSRFVESLASRIAHAARERVDPAGRTDYDDWRASAVFLTPAIALDGYTDLEAAAERSRRGYAAVDEIPDAFSAGVYVTLGVATAIACLLRVGSGGGVAYVYGALFGFPAVRLLGFSSAVAFAVALRTHRYVELETSSKSTADSSRATRTDLRIGLRDR